MSTDKLKVIFHNPNENAHLEEILLKVCIDASIIKLESIIKNKIHIDSKYKS